MTGRFPVHVQEANGPYYNTLTGPPLNMTFLPEYLKLAGYATHHAGKW
jgi:arylsulfatase A-like enzyme